MKRCIGFVAVLLAGLTVARGENWPQYKFDSRHSGNAPDRDVTLPLGLMAAVPLSDAVFTSPVVADGRVYVVDASGVACCFDAASLAPLEGRDRGRQAQLQQRLLAGPGRPLPALRHDGRRVLRARCRKRQGGPQDRCGEPIFSTPVVGKDRVYFATLGSRVYALQPDGAVVLDLGFRQGAAGFHRRPLERRGVVRTPPGSRGKQRSMPSARGAWTNGDRVRMQQQFACSRDIALDGKRGRDAGGRILVWLEDAGAVRALRRLRRVLTDELRAEHRRGRHGLPAVTLARQRRPGRDPPPASGEDRPVRRTGGTAGTRTSWTTPVRKEGRGLRAGTKMYTEGGLLSFSSVSLRGHDVYRCRPEEGFGLVPALTRPQRPQAYAGCYPSITPPILLRRQGRLRRPGRRAVRRAARTRKGLVVQDGLRQGHLRAGGGLRRSGLLRLRGRILVRLGPAGQRPAAHRGPRAVEDPQSADRPLGRRRSTIASRASPIGPTPTPTTSRLQPPLKVHWIRRYEGTAKQFSTFGGGRMYTHTAEGQIFAVEQETGRLLWRRYFPGVHISYTTPLVLPGAPAGAAGRAREVPAALPGRRHRQTALGSPLSGSPSWNRQLPPVVHKNLAIYMFSTGTLRPRRARAGEGEMALRSTRTSTAFPRATGRWCGPTTSRRARKCGPSTSRSTAPAATKPGMCLMDGRLYYSCYFGRKAQSSDGSPGPHGVTAALEPADRQDSLAHDEVFAPRRLHDFGRGRPAVSGRVQSAGRHATAATSGAWTPTTARWCGNRSSCSSPSTSSPSARSSSSSTPKAATATCWTSRPARSSPRFDQGLPLHPFHAQRPLHLRPQPGRD